MGDEALETPEVEPAEVEIVKDEEPKEGDVTPEGEPSEAEPTEVEVIRQGVDGSQPAEKKPNGFQKRIGKLNAKIEAATETASQASSELLIANEKNKLLELALQQKQEAEAVKAPDPDDFVDTAEFTKANNAYTQSLIASEVQKHVANIPAAQSEPVPDTELLNKQTKHYKAAEDLGAKDYAEVEDKAIDILGKDIVNQVIRASDSSPVILYYLGKNPSEAEHIADLIKTDPVKASFQIGRLEAELKIQPRANSQHAPDPDEELEGGSPNTMSGIDKKIEAARVKAQESGDMTELLRLKKEKKGQA